MFQGKRINDRQSQRKNLSLSRQYRHTLEVDFRYTWTPARKYVRYRPAFFQPLPDWRPLYISFRGRVRFLCMCVYMCAKQSRLDVLLINIYIWLLFSAGIQSWLIVWLLWKLCYVAYFHLCTKLLNNDKY